MPLDPIARTVIEQFAAAGPPIGTVPAPEAREASKARRPVIANPEPVHEVTDRAIQGPAGDLPVRIYRPSANAGLPVLVWFHGGGWVLGDLDAADPTCRSLANESGCVVVSVDYRLAPETPFPGAAEDAYAATVWVSEHAAEIGGDPTRIAVGGDSAGGNLAAVVCLVARERGGPRIVHQGLVYPVTDHALDTPSYEENAEGYLLTRSGMQWFWDQYLGDQDRSHPYASPLRAGDLSGLPPAIVITAEFDPLRDEGEAYAARLRECGVATALHRFDGMIHGFFGMSAVLPAGREARALLVGHLRSALAEA